MQAKGLLLWVYLIKMQGQDFRLNLVNRYAAIRYYEDVKISFKALAICTKNLYLPNFTMDYCDFIDGLHLFQLPLFALCIRIILLLIYCKLFINQSFNFHFLELLLHHHLHPAFYFLYIFILINYQCFLNLYFLIFQFLFIVSIIIKVISNFFQFIQIIIFISFTVKYYFHQHFTLCFLNQYRQIVITVLFSSTTNVNYSFKNCEVYIYFNC